MADDRIARLSERFKAHGGGRRPAGGRQRERHSFYLDGGVVARLDRAYRDLNHNLYPRSVSKSSFLEAIIEDGLAHPDRLREALGAAGAISDPPDR